MSVDSWNPKQYDIFKEERAQPFYDLMALLQPHNQAEVVDLGCGTGQLTAILHEHIGALHTVGIDTSVEMLRKAGIHSGNGLTFEMGDIEKWSTDKSLDIIFSNAAIQWCENHPSIFRKLKSSLRSNGQLAIQMPMNHGYPTHVLANKMSHEDHWSVLLDEHYEKQSNMLTVEQYAKLLFDLGFKEQKVFLRVYTHILESREDVIEWVKGTMLTHFKSRLKESDYEKFLTEFRLRLFTELPDERPFFYPFKRILIWARL